MDSLDNLVAAETYFGKYVPLHLLHFTSDPKLQASFRHLLEYQYQNGVVKSSINVCEKCGHQMSRPDKIQMKPSRKKTKKISKLLEKLRKASLFGKYNNFILQRFLKSSTQLGVKCSRCQHKNKQPLITNEAKEMLKQNVMETVQAVSTPAVTPGKSQKKRKRKKNKSLDVNSGLIIPTPSGDQQQTSVSQSTPHLLPTLSQPKPSALTSGAAALGKSAHNTPLSRKGAPPTLAVAASGKKSGMKQKGLKQILDLGGSGVAEKKRPSLADFLSSLS